MPGTILVLYVKCDIKCLVEYQKKNGKKPTKTMKKP